MLAHPIIPIPAIVLISAILITGLVLLWRWQFSPTARQQRGNIPLRPIHATWPYFAAMCLFVILSAVIAQAIFGQFCKWFYPDMPLNTNFAKVLSTGVFDIGAIAGAIYARRFLTVMQTLRPINRAAATQEKNTTPISYPQAILVGTGVFCIIRAVLVPVALAWDWLLNRLGAAATDQELVQIFRDETSPARVAIMTFVAVVVAAITEEIAFRGGLFAYLRTRLPRMLGYLLPALIFAAAHMNLRAAMPLFVLSIILSIAYERTGRIAVPMIAHGLLNLSTIATILLGLDQ